MGSLAFSATAQTYDSTTLVDTNNTAKDTTLAQNFYAQNQKMNPHTPKVMASLGLNEDDVQVFIQECLFPEIGWQIYRFVVNYN